MFDKNNLHHAYLIEGEKEEAENKIKNFLTKELGFPIQGNPDFFEKHVSGLGIEDSREIKEFLIEKPLGKYKIFLLSLSSMTTQSGNALLKSLEEPSPGTHFFIVIPNAKRMLPTLLSRVHLIKLKKAGKNKAQLDPMNFLKSSSDKRIEEIKSILSLYDKEKITKQQIINFFKEILYEYKNLKNYDQEALQNSIISLNYMGDQSSSLKITMEYIGLALK